MDGASDEQDEQDEQDEAAAVAFFDRLYEAYERAEAAAGGPLDRYFLVAGKRVRLRLAGPVLLRYVTRALSHLATGPATGPALTVCVWDSESTGVEMPPPAWTWGHFEQSGELPGFTHGRVLASFQVGPGIFSILDRERGLAIYWIKETWQIPLPEIGAPLRILLHWWAHDQGVEQVHGAAVGFPDGGVLLPGKGGSGKSNTSLACLASDLSFAGDDFCLVSSGPAPHVFSLYSSAKTRPEDQRRLPFLGPWASDVPRAPGEKILYFLNEHAPERLTHGFPLRAILVPRVTGRRDTRVGPGSPALALAALAPSTLTLMPNRAGPTFHTLAGIVRRVPCFVLELGTDASQIPAAIAGLLRSCQLTHAARLPVQTDGSA